MDPGEPGSLVGDLLDASGPKAVSGLPTPALMVVVMAWTALSLTASGVLIVRLERLGGHFGITEASLGLIAALAADAPEITAAVTALIAGERDVGVGIVLGSNVFNLAALLGLSAVVAGRIAFRRRVVVVEGAIGVWLAVVCLSVVTGLVAPGIGLLAALLLFVPYAWVTALQPAQRARIRIPFRARAALVASLAEAEDDIAPAERDIAGPSQPDARPGRDAAYALFSVVVVVVASMRMEADVVDLGHRWGLSSAFIGAVMLAVMTSLPNAVAAVYLARRGRGAATLSEAMNSNTINTIAGLLLPATIIGLGTVSAASQWTALWYAGLTVAALAIAYSLHGIPRVAGLTVIAAYAVFLATLP